MKDKLTKALLDNATLIRSYHVYKGKRGAVIRYKRSSDNHKWYDYFITGYPIPMSKKEMLEKHDLSVPPKGKSSEYNVSLVYNGDKLIAIISDYEYPEVFEKKPTSKKSPAKKRTTRK